MKKWRPHNRNALCWWFFYVIDNARVTFDTPQIMRYMLCYFDHVFSFNPRTKLRKGLIYYYKRSGITCLKKHVDHFKILNFFEEEVNYATRESLKRHFVKMNGKYIKFVHLWFFCLHSIKSFKKNNVEQQKFLKNLAFLVVKCH